jgi:DNA polymerase-4
MSVEAVERRAILHCDLDAFYASVEQRDHPEYRGKPVIVGGRGPGDRGVVAAASYEARAFGVHSAMPLQTAGRLCPDAIFVPGDGQKYEEASDAVMALFADRTPLVEPISLDEAFLDVTATEHLFGGAENIARDLKRDVREQLGLVLSVGVATNKLCAKIGSDLRKPDGLVIVPAGGEEAFLAPLELGSAVGCWAENARSARGLGPADDRRPRRRWMSACSKHAWESTAVHIWERAHGIDEGVVIGDGRTPKSVGHSHTFDRNTLDSATIESMLLNLSEGVGRRLRAYQLRGRTITLHLRVAPFETRTRQRTLAEPTDDDLRIFGTARQLLHDALAEDRQSGRTSPVRLVGVTASGIEVGRQLGLFDHVRTTRLNAALDAVRERFGDKSLDRASARLRERRRFSDRRTKKTT